MPYSRVFLRFRPSDPSRVSPWTEGFTVFFTAQSLSWLGSSMTATALSLGLLDLGLSLDTLAVVLAANSIPLIAFLLLGGVAADRIPRRHVLVASHLAAGVSQAGVTVWFACGGGPVWVLVCASAANGTAAAFTGPALRGVLTELVPPDALGRANAARATSRNVFRLFGPTAAGVLVASVGAQWALGVDSACAIAAAGLLTRLNSLDASGGEVLGGRERLPDIDEGHPLRRAARSFARDVTDGWAAFRSQRWAWIVTLDFFWLNLLLAAVWLVCAPAMAKASIGEAAWGTVLGVRAAGLILGGAIAYRWWPKRPLVAGQVLSGLFGLCFLVLGGRGGWMWIALSAFVAGAGSAIAGVLWESCLQRGFRRDQLSRVSSIDLLGSYAAMPIGQLAAPVVAGVIGLERTVVLGGVVYVVVAALPVFSRSVRRAGMSPHASR